MERGEKKEKSKDNTVEIEKECDKSKDNTEEKEKEKGKSKDNTEKEEEKENLFNYIKKNLENNLENLEENESIFILAPYYHYRKGNEETRIFSENSRYITFINKKINFNKQYFIHDETSLRSALSESKIEIAVLKGEKDEISNYSSNDSKKSDTSTRSVGSLDIDSILGSSINIIEQLEPLNYPKIFSAENFNKRFKVFKISDLDFNFKYFKDFLIDNNLETKQIPESFCREFANISKNTSKYLIIFGPKGVGKSTILLSYLTLNKIRRLYFPIKKMYDFPYKKIKKISLYEALYVFDEECEMEKFNKEFNNFIPNSVELFDFILEYIKLIVEFYKNTKFRKRITIVLDDYDNTLDKNNKISFIIDYIKENRDKLLLCILGECPFIYEKYYEFLKNDNKDYKVIYLDYSIVKENFEDDALKLPLYFYRYKYINNSKENKNIKDIANFKNIIIEEITENFKKMNLRVLLFLNKYLNTFTNINDLKNDFLLFPLEFLKLETKKDNNNIFINFEFKLDLYKEIFENSIVGLLKIENIKLANILKAEQGKNGIDFEDFIVELFWNNIFSFIQFPNNNRIYTENIYNLKDNKESLNLNLEKNKPIIIRQKFFSSKYYDLLIIFDYNDKKYGIIIQIGLSKEGNDINLYLSYLIKYEKKYIEGIGKLINSTIDELGFLLIFEYNKQIELKNKNNKCDGVGFCMKNNIAYFICKDSKLYNDLDSNKPIDKFIITDEMLLYEKTRLSILETFKYNLINLCNEISFTNNSKPNVNLNEEEKEQIINYINIKYEQNYNDLDFAMNYGEKIKPFETFSILNSAGNFGIINICQNDKSKYMYVNNEFLEIKTKKIQSLKKDDKLRLFNDKNLYDAYFLNKKRKYSNDE